MYQRTSYDPLIDPPGQQPLRPADQLPPPAGGRFTRLRRPLAAWLIRLGRLIAPQPQPRVRRRSRSTA